MTFGDEYFIPGSGNDRVRPRPLNWNRVDDSPGKDGSLERFIVVINCSSTKHYVDVPFPSNGTWTDILNDQSFTVSDYWRKWQDVDSNWGRIFYAN